MDPSTPDASPGPPPLPAATPPSMPLVVAPGGVTSEDRTLGMLCHLLGIFTGFLGPLILWLVKKDSSPFIDHHGREALNFQITLLLVLISLSALTFALMIVLVGFLLVPVLVAVPILALVAEILAAVAASDGKWHRYPCCLRLV